jgi:predicted AAA+ superfamily ATPase
MKTLKKLCQPRKSVFERVRRDEVLDLTNLIDDKIKPREFFDENYLTDGMKSLFREAFRSFAGNSSSGIIKLTQAMGGGKTHCMIALGLLARYPELRKEVMGEDYNDEVLGSVRVVAFTGRESDAPFGIWGALAEQLGKKDVFKDYYSPLKAPGQSAWMNLLKGEPLLILLDELPPYLENARSLEVGNSDLSVVTVTALSNLMVAVGKEELSNVCVVISDLKATYEGGTEGIHEALKNFENEVGRTALNLEPVGLNNDDIYHILRKRLFEHIPDDEEVLSIANGYAQVIKDAQQMNITHVSSDKFIRQIRESYPFHPAIKDLYARFRENPGFQQTRGLIRLMRLVVSNSFNEGGLVSAPY